MASVIRPNRPVALILVALLAAAFVASPDAAELPRANAADGSALTVSWLGDNSSAASLQPAREFTSLSGAPTAEEPVTNPHYNEFRGLKVTVEQTQDLTDQVVRVNVSGMPGNTVSRDRSLLGAGNGTGGLDSSFQQNYLQVMQCWGDPLAADFRETCQWGGVIAAGNRDINLTIPYANVSRTDIPFRSRLGAKAYRELGYPLQEGESYTSEILSGSTTNELIGVPVKADGTTSFAFETQTFAQAPWLGCGSVGGDGQPQGCSLVIVPRGTVYGGATPSVGNWTTVSYGESGIQLGSPLATTSDYWDNRIVVPLGFRPPESGCAVGGAETRTSGSQLVAGALASWQRALCTTSGVAIGYTTNADGLSRTQLLQGNFSLGYTSRPVETEGGAKLVYAPLTVSGLTFAFQISGNKGPITELRLTPRLIAKLITRSYAGSVPRGGYSDQAMNAHLDGNPYAVGSDPEFLANNPQFPRSEADDRFLEDAVLMGPSGSDAIRLLWEYLLADDSARAFLKGDADEYGMKINPYYLPAGSPKALAPKIEEVITGSESRLRYVTGAAGGYVPVPVGLTNADGAPLDLTAAPIDYLPQADRFLAPATISSDVGYTPRNRIDVISQNPYGESYSKVALRIFRADPLRPEWDPNKDNAVGTPRGAWVSIGPQQMPGIRIVGTTDSAAAAAYQLATAELQLPNKPGVFVGATPATLGAGLAAQRPVDGGPTVWTDFSALEPGAYPLTIVTYAAVNLDVAKPKERDDFAALLTLASTSGQTAGNGTGQLPEGYAPLSDELRTQASAAIELLRNPPQASPSSAPARSAAPKPLGETATSVGAASKPQTVMTPAVSATPAAAVGGSLLVGIVGLIAAPFLLRRRTLG